MKRWQTLILAFMVSVLVSMVIVAQETRLTLITAQQNSNVRSAASSNSTLVGVLAVGESALVIAENNAGESLAGISLWYQVQLANGQEGWVWSGAVSSAQVTPMPTPTPRPTLTSYESAQPFNTVNYQDVRLLATLPLTGRHQAERVAWAPGGESIVVATRLGLWHYTSDDFTIPAVQIATFAENTWGIVRLDFINDDSVYIVKNIEDVFELQVINIVTRATSSDVTLGHKDDIGAMAIRGTDFVVGKQNQLMFYEITLEETQRPRIRLIRSATIEVDVNITSIAFSPDGARMSLSGSHPTNQHTIIYIFSTSDYSTLLYHDLRDAIVGINSATFTPDGSTILLIGNWMKFRAIDVETGQQIREFDTGYAINDTVLTPDGTALAILSAGFRGIPLLNLSSGEMLYTSNEAGNNIRSLAFSPDGQKAAYVFNDYYTGSYLRVRDFATGADIYLEPYVINNVYLDPIAGGRMFMQIADQFAIYDTNNLHTPIVQFQIPLWVQNFAVSPDQSTLTLAGVSLDGLNEISHLQVWDITAQQAISDDIPVSSQNIVYHPNGRTITVLREGILSIRDIPTLQEVDNVIYAPLAEPIRVYAYNQGGELLATAGKGNNVRLWDANYNLLNTFTAYPEDRQPPITELLFVSISADGRRILASDNEHVFVWDIVTRQQIQHLFGIYFNGGRLNTDGSFAYLYTSNSGVIVYSLETNEIIGNLPVSSVEQITFIEELILETGYEIRLWGVPRDFETITYDENLIFEDDFEIGRIRGWGNLNTFGRIEREEGNTFVRLDNTTGDYFEFLPSLLPQMSNSVLEIRVRVMQSFDQTDNHGFDFMFLQPDVGIGLYDYEQSTWTANIFSREGSGLYGMGVIRFSRPQPEWINLRIEAVEDAEIEASSLRIFVDDVLIHSVSGIEYNWSQFTFSSPPSTIVDIDNVRIYELQDVGQIPTATPTLSPTPTQTPTLPPTPTPSPTFTPTPVLVFHDDFEDGNLAGWDLSYAGDSAEVTIVEGNNHVLHVTGSQNDYVSLGFMDNLSAANVLEARIQFLDLGPDNGSIDFILESENPGHGSGYSALISTGGASLMNRNENFRDIELSIRQDFQILLDHWYHIRFESTEQSLTLSVDGIPRQIAQVEVLETGQPVFIFARGMEVYLDDVRVERLNN